MSVGNKADVSGNDLLRCWAEDSRTSVILLYVSFGNPRSSSRIARRVARTKPIVAVQAGRSRAGARAASSHTGALAVSDTVVDALFRQAGVIRTDTLQELFVWPHSSRISRSRTGRGSRSSRMPAGRARPTHEAQGLQMATLSEATRATLRSFLPASASVSNPVDMIASASADHYRRATAAILADDGVDLLVIFILMVTEPDAVAQAIVDGRRNVQEAGARRVHAGGRVRPQRWRRSRAIRFRVGGHRSRPGCHLQRLACEASRGATDQVRCRRCRCAPRHRRRVDPR